MTSLFDNALRFMRQRDPNFQPMDLKKAAAELRQRHPLSRELAIRESVPVRLLRDIPLPTRYTKKGEVAKRQPMPYLAGEVMYLVNMGDRYVLSTSDLPILMRVMENPVEGTDFEF